MLWIMAELRNYIIRILSLMPTRLCTYWRNARLELVWNLAFLWIDYIYPNEWRCTNSLVLSHLFVSVCCFTWQLRPVRKMFSFRPASGKDRTTLSGKLSVNIWLNRDTMWQFCSAMPTRTGPKIQTTQSSILSSSTIPSRRSRYWSATKLTRR